MTKSKEPYRWGTLRRVKMSVTMRGNTNAVGQSFSAELESEYSDDPELLAWIQANKAKLDARNPDGSVPMSELEIEKTADKQLFNDYAPTDGH